MFLPTPGNTLSCYCSVIQNQHLDTRQAQSLEILPGCHVDPKAALRLFQALVIVSLFFPQRPSLISSLLPIQLKVKGQRTPISSCSLLLKWNIWWLTGLPYCRHRETCQDGYRHTLQFTLSCFSGFGLILFLPFWSSLSSYLPLNPLLGLFVAKWSFRKFQIGSSDGTPRATLSSVTLAEG